MCSPIWVSPSLNVSQHEGAYRVGGTRASLDSIVYTLLEGQTLLHFGECVQSSQSPGVLLIPQRLPVPEAVNSSS